MNRKYIKAQWLDSDGYWIELKPGWCDGENNQCHTITEDTKQEAHQHIVARCHCGCERELER